MIDLLFFSKNPLFPAFSTTHLVLLGLPVLLIIGMLKNKALVRDSKGGKAIWFGLMGLLLGQQVLLYSWYYFTGNFDFRDALPLYPCRISSLLCIVLMIHWREDLFNLLFFMGLPGATLALLMPDTWNLGFPNAMCIQFFAGHSAILMTIFYLTIKHNYRLSNRALKSAYKYCSIYLGILLIVNHFLQSNYAYMAHKPNIPAFAGLPDYPYHLPIFIGGMYFLFFVLYMVWPNKVSEAETVELQLEN